MKVTMFHNRFVQPILDGVKITTIRGRAMEVGEVRSFRVWTDKPYRSKQREFCRATITSVQPFSMHSFLPYYFGMYFGHDKPYSVPKLLNDNQMSTLAKGEGFKDYEEMLEFFEKVHGDKRVTDPNGDKARVKFNGWLHGFVRF